MVLEHPINVKPLLNISCSNEVLGLRGVLNFTLVWDRGLETPHLCIVLGKF